MAVLNETARVGLWKEFMSEISGDREPLDLSKAELRAAVNALDDWLDTNAILINAAIPQPARSNMTVSQKARLLSKVALWRYVTDN